MADMENIVDLIFEDKLEEAEDGLLLEGIEEKLLHQIGENSYMNILLKFESYLNSHDIYLFGNEWDNATILLNKLKVDKFWVTIYMVVDKKTDLRGAKRVVNDKEKQNEVKFKKLENGKTMIRFRILKRYLDQIEQDDKERAMEIANRETP